MTFTTGLAVLLLGAVLAEYTVMVRDQDWTRLTWSLAGAGLMWWWLIHRQRRNKYRPPWIHQRPHGCIVDAKWPGRPAMVCCCHGTVWPEGADWPTACEVCCRHATALREAASTSAA